MTRTWLIAILALSVVQSSPTIADAIPAADWPSYGRADGGGRYSPLAEINPSNVKGLESAWTYHHGDLGADDKANVGNVFECTPLVVDGVMYLVTPYCRAVALNAATGTKIWDYLPEGKTDKLSGMRASRGVAFWRDGAQARVFLPVRDGRILSLDAATGLPDKAFADEGVFDLRDHFQFGAVRLTSPPAIFEDVLITGHSLPDSTGMLKPFPVLGIDVRTGEVRWKFNTVPQAGEFGTDTWAEEAWRARGGTNIWSLMSVDTERGLVFLPCTAADMDFYGGDRHGQNLFSNSLVALDARTGERRWHYQIVHHGLWDYDLPAQPILVDITVDGKRISAVVQLGKTGFAYVFNRENGEPVWPIEERTVPASDVPGEQVWPTQPFPTKPPALSKQGLSEDELSHIDPETNAYVREQFRKYRAEGLFTPPSLQGTVVMPGFHGGCNWSGGAFDPEHGRLYVNTTEVPCIAKLVEFTEGHMPYRFGGYMRFRDQNGYPANAPPWGKLVCVDLNEGTIAWEVPLGEHEELSAKGVPQTGQENIGGATVTAGGLVFIASTPDAKFRAFSAMDGQVLWETRLRTGAYAAPISYAADGRQYVAICVGGGHKNGLLTPHDDSVVAFALPD